MEAERKFKEARTQKPDASMNILFHPLLIVEMSVLCEEPSLHAHCPIRLPPPTVLLKDHNIASYVVETLWLVAMMMVKALIPPCRTGGVPRGLWRERRNWTTG